MKKNMEAVWKLPSKQHSISSPFSPKLGWIGSAIQQATSKHLPGLFFFNTLIFIELFIYKTIETHAHAFLPLNISAVGSVISDDDIYIFCRSYQHPQVPIQMSSATASTASNQQQQNDIPDYCNLPQPRQQSSIGEFLQTFKKKICCNYVYYSKL